MKVSENYKIETEKGENRLVKQMEMVEENGFSELRLCKCIYSNIYLFFVTNKK